MGKGGIGAVLGGGAGFLIGGPAGAAIGAGIGGGVGGSMDQASAAESAANAQVNTSARSIALQKEMFDKEVALNQPWQDAGLKALTSYAKNPAFKFSYNDMTADPGYKFRMEQGVNALDMSAASRGKLLSGAQEKALTQYGQDIGAQEYGNAYSRALQNYNTEQNRQLNIANIGRGAAGQTQNAMQNYTSGVGNAYSAQGSAIAQGALNKANAEQGLVNTINQGMGNYLLYNMMQPGA